MARTRSERAFTECALALSPRYIVVYSAMVAQIRIFIAQDNVPSRDDGAQEEMGVCNVMYAINSADIIQNNLQWINLRFH